jgi:hypothetical protein
MRATVSRGVLVGIAAMFLTSLVVATGSERLGFDFRANYLMATDLLRETGSPYVPAGKPLEEGQLPYVYPPQLAFVLVPLTALSKDAACFLAFVVSLVALLGALAVVGVRDVRCFAAVLIWAPGFNALEMANISACLALAVALVWRYRSSVLRSSLLLGITASTKLFLWPLLVWTIVERRYSTACLAAATGVVVTIGAWGAIGFDSFTSFPDQLARIPFETSYSIPAMTVALGGSDALGAALSAIVGGALLGAVVVLGRRGDEFRAFTCAIAASLALTPVVWQHYLVLLAVPLGIALPRFSPIWLAPVLLWVSPRAGNGEGFETFVPAAVTVTVFALILLTPRKTAGVQRRGHAGDHPRDSRATLGRWATG